MTYESKTAFLIWMTNRSRARLYKKIAEELAASLGISSYKEKFIDTSYIEDPTLGEKLLTDSLLRCNNFLGDKVVVLIKDLKWKPQAEKIYKFLNKADVYLAEVDLRVVERFTEDMNTQGLYNHIRSLIKVHRE